MRALLLAFLVLIGSGAQGAVITMDFSATGFTGTAPTNPVTGTLTWSAASLGAPIDELLSIDMNINGHQYTVAELGTHDLFGYLLVGSLTSGLNGVNPNANAADFFIGFDPLTETFVTLVYTVQGVTNESWGALSGAVDVTSVITQVPEPGSLTLFLVALAGTAVARRIGQRRTNRG